MGAADELPTEHAVRVTYRSPRSELIDATLQVGHSEYSELADNWKLLDSKAHATVAIAGLFLAAIFASKILDSAPAIAEKWLVGILIGCLLAAIVCAVMAMRVATYETPPDIASTWRTVESHMELDLTDKQLREAKFNLHGKFIEQFVKANGILYRCNATKAKWLVWGQGLLLAAAAVAAALLMWRIIF